MKTTIRRVLFLAMASLLGSASSALASGHGPVFGMTTPTNAKGGWSLDLGLMGRQGQRDSGAVLRAMLSYGITEDLQVSVTAPVVFGSPPLFAPARVTGMMPATSDFEAFTAWRFHRQATNVGFRFETTAYAGIVMPGPQKPFGLRGDFNKAPGGHAAIATGFTSRSHYFWVGTGYTGFAEADGDRRPAAVGYSVVWGYRPPPLRKEYPHWDGRLFIEMSGSRSGKLQRRGAVIPETGGHDIFLGPTTLWIYKNYAIEGGIQFPVYSNIGALHQRERFRFTINISCFF